MSTEASLTFAEALQAAMAQELDRDETVFAYGEGINDPGGFFGTTVGLRERFGEHRCFDVPNCEETLAGFGLGAALGGLRPVFVNLRIEFLLLATNQLVNHIAKWGSMQGRDVDVPFTLRAMVGRGWGQGAQHSGSYAAMLAHVPGLQVAVSSGPREGAGLLVSAIRGQRPTVLIEPKAVYESVDLVRTTNIPPMAIGRAFVRRVGSDFTIVALGDTVQVALLAAERLQEQHSIEVEVIDLCSLAPFDAATIRTSVAKTGRVGVIDIGWESFGVAAEVALCLQKPDLVPLRGPLLSWAPNGHAPAGCFAEARHYPTEKEVEADIIASLSPPSSRGSAWDAVGYSR